MNLLFDDTPVKESLYPFTVIRNAADIRIGILSIREKWELILQKLGYHHLATTLQANMVPTINYVKLMDHIKSDTLPVLNVADDVRILEHPWHIFEHNDWAIRQDFALITANRPSQPIPPGNTVIAPENVFIEAGATISCSTINAAAGPVYIGKNAEIMEGCIIRGPLAMCEGAVLKMGTKVYGATTLGPYCVGGGEIKNSVLFGYTNKAHDGYLGDSVLGEWCNLGAGTTNSNLKNTATPVKVWSRAANAYITAGKKCGLLMGDYSRSAINTAFNTGTVVGVSCNIFGAAYPPKYVPDFSWGGEKYIFEKALQDIANWKKLKGKTLSTHESTILESLYNPTNTNTQ
jgi:UDP-N-acetylglucosamine diphosphorylase / glucose-1-phosphate thymidylyltransferase / UDP-N-acetylgalactosamine diphosphorylase / glucosamine-1-phosphate N-acetyltransferase / galactosamine-1-phosphate N-acetyltransferase